MIKLHGEFEIDFIKKILKLGMTDRQTAGKTAMKSNNSPPPPPPAPDFTGRGLINGISAEI